MRPEDSATDWHLSESQLEDVARKAAAPPPAAAPKKAEPVDPLIGQSLRGYRVERKLGQGGMGAVYLAVHEQLQRQVAIKLLPPAMAEDEQLISRFRREARALAKLDSPHIVPVHDMFELDGRFFIAMGLAAGGSVKDLLKSGPLDEGRARRILLETARGLASAHSQGIVHRDIKPDNLLLDEQGRVKIADFGLAKGGLGAQGLTVVGTVMGTPAYMSPEQWDDSSSADIRSDLYSLGCTFFKMLTGRAPFKRSGLSAYMKAHCSEPVPDVRGLRPDVSASSVSLLQRLLEKDAGDRLQTPAELVELLEGEARSSTLLEPTPKPQEPAPAAETQPATAQAHPTAAATVWPSQEGSSKPASALESSHLSGAEASAPAAAVTEGPSAAPAAAVPAEPTVHGQAAPLAARGGAGRWLLAAVALLLLGAGVWWGWPWLRPAPVGPGGGGNQGGGNTSSPPQVPELWWPGAAVQVDAAARLKQPLAISEQGADFVLLPQGSFLMGSPLDAKPRLPEEVPHHAALSADLWMMAHEVSRGLWERVMQAPLPSEEGRTSQHPAVKISWLEAVRFCNNFSLLQARQPAYQIDGDEVRWLADVDGYRLPTEAEWEYACRAGTLTPYSSGARLTEKDANFSAMEDFLFSEGSLMQLAEVGTLRANPWGLFDMHGNAYEWCFDYYGAYPNDAGQPEDAVRDPQGPALGSNRIIRGGSGYRDASYCRSARRAHLQPATRGESVGFRVVRPVR